MTPFDTLLKLPCGRCKGCRLEKSRQWAIRLMHEAQLHDRTCFITLTYDDEHLPTRGASSQSLTAPRASRPRLPRGLDRPHTRETRTYEIQERTASLEPRHLQLFTKSLNESARRRFGEGVRYYACGEYGERTHRPHYHIAVYGEDFSDDRQFWKTAKSGHPLWRSSRLKKLWEHGDADIGDLTFESAAYVARYIMKKVNGSLADEHYRRTDEHGQDYWIEPEFSRMSRGGRGTRGGLGRGWFEEYNTSVYPHDRVIARGHPSKPPRYYDKLLEALRPLELEAVKAERAAKINPESQLPDRLRAGEAILNAKLNQLKRPLE